MLQLLLEKKFHASILNLMIISDAFVLYLVKLNNGDDDDDKK